VFVYDDGEQCQRIVVAFSIVVTWCGLVSAFMMARLYAVCSGRWYLFQYAVPFPGTV